MIAVLNLLLAREAVAQDSTPEGGGVEPEPVASDPLELDGTQPWFSEHLPTSRPSGVVDPADLPEEFRRKKQFQRWWHRYRLMNDPESGSPLSFRDLFASRLRTWERLEAMRAGSGGAASLSWVGIGPAPTQSWINTSQTVSGQVVDVVVHPTTANTWLIAGSTAGLWLTTTAGSAWNPKTDTQATLAVGALAYAPGTPTTIYAGTGSYVGFGGVGVLKSTNGGNSWQLLASSTFTGQRFHDIRVHPTNANTVVAATSSGVYRSTDGGTTWSNRRTGDVTDLEIDPGNFNRQYAGVQGNNAVDGLYRSTDGGQTWTILPGTPWQNTGADNVGRIELAIAPSNASIMYVGLNVVGVGDVLYRTANVWVSTPSWTQITSAPSYCGTQCGYDHELIVKPTNSNILFAGGVELYKYNHSTGTWTDISRAPLSSGIHVDQHAMAWSGSRLIVGNDGGLFSTMDDGVTWSRHNNGLAISEFYHGSLHPTDASVVQGGQQDNGSTRRPSGGGTVWNYAAMAADGADNFFTSANPDTRWVLSTQGLGLVRFKDGAQCNVFESIPDLTGAPFIATAELCPKSDDVVLAGTDNVWKTTQMFSAACSPTTPSWTKACAGDSDGGEMGAGVLAIGFAPGATSCATFAFGAVNGKLRITLNGGTSCTNLDPGGQVPDAIVSDLALHPCFGKNPSQANDTETMYVTLGGVGHGHVYKTTNALAGTPSWTDVTPEDGGQPFDVAHKTIAIDPLVPNHLYVGTDLGLWRSTDSGAVWTHVGPVDGLLYMDVTDIQMNEGTDQVVVFSHGRSAFSAGVTRCTGDCNGDGVVTGTEITKMVNIQGQVQDLCLCAIGDSNHDGRVSGTEVTQAVNNQGNGCPG